MRPRAKEGTTVFKRFKEILFDHFPPRMLVVMVVMVIFPMILIGRLFEVQILKGEEYTNDHKKRIEKDIIIHGVRGKIYDRKGELLAYNKMSKALVLENPFYDEHMTTEEYYRKLNAIIFKLVDILDKNGEKLMVPFPIELNQDGEFEYSTQDQAVLMSFLKNAFNHKSTDELTPREKSITAEEFVTVFCFGTEDPELKKVAPDFQMDRTLDKATLLKGLSIRYNMYLTRFMKFQKNLIAENLKDGTIIDVNENKADLPGVQIEDRMIRVYNDSVAFSNIIGYTGPRTADDIVGKETDDLVGKLGLEKNLNDVLRAPNGTQKIYVDSTGNIIEEGEEQRPGVGKDIYLSIDAGLQKYIYNLAEENLTKYYLKCLTPSLHVRKSVKETGGLIINAGEVYRAIINNDLLNLRHLYSNDASEAEIRIRKALDNAKKNQLERLKECFQRDQPLKDFEDVDYNTVRLFFRVLQDKGYLPVNNLDLGSDTVKQWQASEISPKAYLTWLIGNNLIETNLLELGEKYSTTEEIFSALIEKVNRIVDRQSQFVHYLSKGLVQDQAVTGRDLIEALYDQGILKKDESYEEFKSGVDTYSYMRQLIADRKLTPGMLGLDPFSMSVVVNDPKTGKVLAMVSYPGYDNNRVSDNDYMTYLLNTKSSPMLNRPTQMMKAPGSTFKPITAYGALMDHVVTPYDYVVCTGLFTRVHPSPKCWIYPGSHGAMNTTSALANSCNVYFNEMGYRLGSEHSDTYDSKAGLDRIRKYATMFGLNEKTGIELDEIKPSISDDDAIMSAIGQGSHLYNMADMARYFTTIANNGNIMQLSVIDHVHDENTGTDKVSEPVIQRHVDLDPSAIGTVRRGLEDVVRMSYNRDSFTSVPVQVAGKTGTAEEDLTKYPHSSFVGYAPAQDPEVVIALVIPNIYSLETFHTSSAGSILEEYFKKYKE